MDDYVEIKTENKIEPEVPKKKRKRMSVGGVYLIIVIIIIILSGVFYNQAIFHIDRVVMGTGLPVLNVEQDSAATVGSEIISMEELNSEFEKIPEELKAFTSKSDMLDRMINQKLLLNAVNELEIEISDEDINENIEELKIENGLDDEGFEKRLEEVGTTIEDLKKQTRSMLLIERYFDETIFKDLVLSTEEGKNYYDENMELFEKPDTVKVSHILISTEDRTEEEALKIVEEIKLKFDAEEFSDLVEEYSEDPGKVMNQGVYEFGAGEMVPEFEKASFALEEVNEISEPVKTTYGYHIIKLLDKNEARTLQFDEVKEDIEEALKNEIKDSKVRDLIEELREKGDITVLFKEEIVEEGLVEEVIT